LILGDIQVSFHQSLFQIEDLVVSIAYLLLKVGTLSQSLLSTVGCCLEHLVLQFKSALVSKDDIVLSSQVEQRLLLDSEALISVRNLHLELAVGLRSYLFVAKLAFLHGLLANDLHILGHLLDDFPQFLSLML
jgi:hypothetical protein